MPRFTKRENAAIVRAINLLRCHGPEGLGEVLVMDRCQTVVRGVPMRIDAFATPPTFTVVRDN